MNPKSEGRPFSRESGLDMAASPMRARIVAETAAKIKASGGTDPAPIADLFIRLFGNGEKVVPDSPYFGRDRKGGVVCFFDVIDTAGNVRTVSGRMNQSPFASMPA